MALSGSVTTNSYDGRYYRLDWTASQSITGNYSDVTWKLYSVGGNHNWYNEYALNVIIVNEYVLSKTDCVARYTGLISSGTKRIYHNNNGDASFSIAVSAAVYYSTINCAGSNSFVLNNIPRASTVSLSSSSIKTGETVTVNINRNVPSYTHKIYYVTPDGCAYTTGFSQTTDIGTSCTFTPQASSIAPKIPNSKSIVLKIVVRTYSGGTQIGEYQYANLTVTLSDDIKPTCELNVGDQYGYDQIYGKMIATLSCYSAFITNEKGIYGSTISKYTIKMNNETYLTKTAVSSPIKSESYNTVTATVTDSRGVTSDPVAITLEVLPYSYPKINSFEVRRCDENGVTDDEGLYANITYSIDISSLENTNEKNARILYKSMDEDEHHILDITLSDYSQYGNIVLPGISDVLSYNFILEINDHFGNSLKSVNISTADTPIDFGMKGKGISIGKVCTEEGLTVNWDANFKGKIMKDGSSLVNSCYYTTGSVSSIYHSYYDICSLTITEPGLYLVLGSDYSSINNSDGIILAGIELSEGDKLTNNLARTTMHSGGGCSVWDLVNITKETTIRLKSYGYLDADYYMKGSLAAIRLS